MMFGEKMTLESKIKYDLPGLREAVRQAEETQKQEAMKILNIVDSAKVREIGYLSKNNGVLDSGKEEITLPSGIKVVKWYGYDSGYDVDCFGAKITSKSGEVVFDASLHAGWPTEPSTRTLKTGEWQNNFEQDYKKAARASMRALRRKEGLAEKLREETELLEKASRLGLDPEKYRKDWQPRLRKA